VTNDADGTGKGLVAWYESAAKQGYMNKETAGSYRIASTRVLSIDDDWESKDLRQLNVEEHLRRFENLAKQDLSPRTLGLYGQRFTRARELYLKYLDDPKGFQAPKRGGASTRKKSSGDGRAAAAAVPGAAGTQVTLPPADPAPPADPSKTLVTYPFPIRSGMLAQISLPADLSKAEAKRLAAFVESLAMDEPQPQRALPAPQDKPEV
jgi:hypothetical protein